MRIFYGFVYVSTEISLSLDTSYSAMAVKTDMQLTTGALFWEKMIVALFCTMVVKFLGD
jgi:hypothetical protein